MISDLNFLKTEALRIATEHGFTEASPAEDIALMHSELSEALEDIRAGKPLDVMFYTRKIETSLPSGDKVNVEVVESDFSGPSPDLKPCGVPSELADVLIRLLHFCGKHKIDIAEAVSVKMKYNDTRPYRNGGKRF